MSLFKRKKEDIKYPKLRIDIWRDCLLDSVLVLLVAFILISAILMLLGIKGDITLEDVKTIIYGRYILALIHADYVVVFLLVLCVIATAIADKIRARLRKEWLENHSEQTLSWFTEQVTSQQKQEFETELRTLCESCSKGEVAKLIQWLLSKEEEGLIILPKVTKKIHETLSTQYGLKVTYAALNGAMPSRKK